MIPALLSLLAIGCNGHTDVTSVLQRLLDQPAQEIVLPATPQPCMARTLHLRGDGRTLRGGHVKLMPGTNAPLLVVAGDNATVSGGTWDGNAAGQTAGAEQWGVGVITVTGEYPHISGVTVLDAHSVGLVFTGLPNGYLMSFGMTEPRRTVGGRVDMSTFHRPRGTAVLADGAPWTMVTDIAVVDSWADGVVFARGSHHWVMTRSVIDFRGTREWRPMPWEQYCQYGSGVTAWGDATDGALSHVWIYGPEQPRPDCHLFIGVSMANGSDRSVVSHVEVVMAPEDRAEYCLEAADVSDVVYAYSTVRACESALSLGAGYSSSVQSRLRVIGGRVSDAEIGALIHGRVSDVRVEGVAWDGVDRVLSTWDGPGAPTDYEVAP
jgi:hypothetical protein